MSAGPSRATSRASKWSKCVREIIADFLYVLDPDQKFIYASPSCKTITQYEPAALVGRPVIEFIHADDRDLFLRELEYSRKSRTPVRFFYRFHTINTHWVIIDCQAQWHADYQMNAALPAPHIAAYQGYLIVSRPYLNETTKLWDSFLEMTIEKERLTRLVAELRKEQDEQEAQIVNSKEKDAVLMDARIQKNSSSQESTVNSPLKGDCGIALPQIKPTKNPAAKRKIRRIGELHRCSSCDTHVSPEWRNGPRGPKTLCNACGCKLVWYEQSMVNLLRQAVRWAKRLKVADKSELLA